MDATNPQLDELRAGLGALQAFQLLYDADLWDIEEPAFEKLRHIHIHLSITVGKLAKLIEPRDHEYHRGEQVDPSSHSGELQPILADLLIHTAQIANMTGLELANVLQRRCAANALRFAPGSKFNALFNESNASASTSST